MKPFLGINLTADKKNQTCNGAEFLVQQPSLALSQAHEGSSKKAENKIAQAELPLLFRIIRDGCGLLAIMGFCGIIRGLGNVSLPEAYQNAAWIFWAEGVCLLIWALVKFWGSRKQRTVLETDESNLTFSALESTGKAIFSELSVPEYAREVDLLSFFYKEKGDTIKVCEKGMQITPYINPIFKIFSDSENLYLANLEGKYAFPLNCLKSIRTVKKHIRIPFWNKEESFDKGVYKQYRLTSDNYECIHCKRYHILELDHAGKLWGIYIPCYELSVFEELTGLTALTE